MYSGVPGYGIRMLNAAKQNLFSSAKRSVSAIDSTVSLSCPSVNAAQVCR